MCRNQSCVWILLADTLLFPMTDLSAALLGYELIVHDGLIFAVMTSVIYFTASILLIVSKQKCLGKLYQILLSVNLLLNIVNFLFYFVIAESGVALLLVAAWFVPNIVLIAFYIKPIACKIPLLVLSGGLHSRCA